MDFWPSELSEQILQNKFMPDFKLLSVESYYFLSCNLPCQNACCLLLWLFYEMTQISCLFTSSPSSWPGMDGEMLWKKKNLLQTLPFLYVPSTPSGGQAESSTAGSVPPVMGMLWNITWQTTSPLTASMISSNTTRRLTCDVLSSSCASPTLCPTPALTRPRSTYRHQTLLSCHCPCLALGGVFAQKIPWIQEHTSVLLVRGSLRKFELYQEVWTWYNKEWSLEKQFPRSNWQSNENCNAVGMCQFFCLCSVLQHPVGWVGCLIVGCGLAAKGSWSVPSGSSVTGAVSPNSSICLTPPSTSPCQSWLGFTLWDRN